MSDLPKLEFDDDKPAAPPGGLPALSFDDDKPTVIAPKEVGSGEAFGRGVKQGGTLGWGDEISGGIDALLGKLTGVTAANKKLADEGFKGDIGPTTAGETYKAGRDEERAANKAAKDAHPWLYGGGQAVGGIVGGMAGGAALNAGKGATILSQAIRGAGGGMIGGLGASDAQDVGGMARDTALGGALGGAAAGAGAYVAPKAADVLRNFAKNRAVAALGGNLGDKARIAAKDVKDELGEALLDNNVVGYGRGAAGMGSKIDELLDTVGERLGGMRNAVDEANPQGAIDLTPLARKGGTLQAMSGSSLPEEQAVANAYANSVNALANTPQRTLAETGDVIRKLGDNAGYGSARLGDTVEQQANRELRSDLGNRVRDAVAQHHGPDVMPAYDKDMRLYSLLSEGGNIADKTALRQEANSPLSFRDAAAMLLGHGGLKGAALGLASKVARERGNATLATAANDLAQSMPGRVLPNAITTGQVAPDVVEYLRNKGLLK